MGIGEITIIAAKRSPIETLTGLVTMCIDKAMCLERE